MPFGLAHGALHLLVSDEDLHVAAGRESACLQAYLGHQRTGRVDHLETGPSAGSSPSGPRTAGSPAGIGGRACDGSPVGKGQRFRDEPRRVSEDKDKLTDTHSSRWVTMLRRGICSPRTVV
jgi:hypothetical protein